MKTLLDYELRKMTKDEVTLLVMSIMIEIRGENEEFAKTVKDFDVYRHLDSKINVAAMATLKAFVAGLCATPVQCALWAHTIDVLELTDLEKFCLAFRNGIPTDAAYALAWKEKDDTQG